MNKKDLDSLKSVYSKTRTEAQEDNRKENREVSEYLKAEFGNVAYISTTYKHSKKKCTAISGIGTKRTLKNLEER